MEKFSIKGVVKQGGLNEAEHNNVEMSIVTLDNKRVTNFLHCKDYFQDVFYSKFFSKQKESRYGFTWQAKDNKSLKNKNKIRVLIRKHVSRKKKYTFVELSKKLPTIKSYLARTTGMIGIDPFKVKIINGLIAVDIPIKHFKHPTITSLIFYLLRTSLEYENEKESIVNFTLRITDKCPIYWLQHTKALDLFEHQTLKSLKKVKWSYFNSYSRNGDGGNQKPEVHNRSGFCNYYNNIKKK